MAKLFVIKRLFIALSALLAITFSLGSVSYGQSVSSSLKEKANASTVTILSAPPENTQLDVVMNIARELDRGFDLRVLPLLGKGGSHNVRDLLYLAGVDMAILQSDAVASLSNTPGYEGLTDRLNYITTLYNEEIHLITNDSINTVSDLKNKRVNFGVKGSNDDLSARALMNALKVDVQIVNEPQDVAREMLEAGTLDATLIVAGKPSAEVKQFTEIDNIKLLPIAFDGALISSYLPATLSQDDYPNLIASDDIETISVTTFLATYASSTTDVRTRRITHFINRFFSAIGAFEEDSRHHKKWQEVDIASSLPGWTRFKGASDWLTRNDRRLDTAKNDTVFTKFVRETGASIDNLNEEEQDALFQKFLRWQSDQ